MQSKRLAKFRERFFRLSSEWSCDSVGVERCFRRWICALSDEKRYYHNIWHVAELLRHLEAHQADISDPEAIQWAILYHDYCSDGWLRCGVKASARRASDVLVELGAPLRLRSKVQRYILATEHHLPTDDRDLAYLLDFDLAILAARPDRYNAYVGDVRREYRWLPTPVFRRRRNAFLRRYLGRAHLYQTDAFRRTREAAARANMQAELRAGGRSLGNFGIPQKSRRVAYRACRATFESMRGQLLDEHPGRMAVFDDGTFSGVRSADDARDLLGSDYRFSFVVESEQREKARAAAVDADIWSLLAEPYLDTDMPQSVDWADRVMYARGLSQRSIKRLRRAVGTGLWWNAFWWEWCELGRSDVLAGWRSNNVFVVILCALTWPFLGYWTLVPALSLYLANWGWQRYWTGVIDSHRTARPGADQT